MMRTFSLKPAIGILIGVLTLGTLLALDAYVTYVVFASRFPGANDFYSRWAGGRAFLIDGLNPYSDEVTRRMQLGMYGHLAEEGADQVAFAYPMYTIYLFFPLSLIPSYPQAQAIWQAILEFALLLAVFSTLRIYRWQPKPWLLAATCLWSILFYPGARSIILGQFAIVVFAFITLALWAVKESKDILAGACLALSTIKPQMVFLLIPLLLLWAIYHRRWRLVGGFVMSMIVLVLSSLLLVPTWPADFLAWMVKYPSYTAIGSPIWTLTHYFFPQLGTPVEIVISLLVLGHLLYAWRGAVRGSWLEFDWVVAMTLIVTNLIALRTATTNYVVLLMPIFIVFKTLDKRFQQGGAMLVSLIELLLLVGFWVLFATTVAGNYEHPIMYLPLPIGLWLIFVAAQPHLTRLAVE
ncbi:MAG: glycosyltransferase family 87 protein [Anaerolineae bacterium]